MKKFVKMSLVAAVAVAGMQNVALAGDDLAEAFKNGKVKGQLKSYFFSKTYDKNENQDASILVNGVILGYKTGDFYGFSLGTTAQFSSVTSKDDPDATYNSYMNSSGTVMSEMYLQYSMNKTTLKAGRQFFWTPVVGGSGSRFNRQAFEGYSLTNTDIADTKITAAYLTKFQERTDGFGEPGEFTSDNSRVGSDGTWTVYAKNNSVDNLTLQAQYAAKSEATDGSKNGWDILYVDGKYNFGGNMKPYIVAQYLTTDYEDTTKDAKAYGVKIGATFSGVSAYAAFTSVGDSNVKQGIGSGSIPLFTNGATVDAWTATLADTDSYKVGLGYTINSLTLGTSYANYDTKDVVKDVSETNFTVTYKFSKNLTAQIQYSLLENERIVEKNIDTDLRTRLIYSF